MRAVTIDVLTYRKRYNGRPQLYRALCARHWLLDRMWEPPTLQAAALEVTPR